MIDTMIGKKFNKWTVLEQAPSRNRKKYYKCQCECGTVQEVCGTDLRNNKSKGCMSCRNRKDITGQRFGKLIALYSTQEKDNNNSFIWMCQCDCGKLHKVSTHNLLTGNIKSCGCSRSTNVSIANQKRANNLQGQRFGKLIVLEKAPNIKDRTAWKCLCDCGNIHITTTKCLLEGHTISCGCYSASKGEEKIQDILKTNSIEYKREISFDDCIFIDTKRKARFDFYLPKYNTIIEYDGPQHYQQGTGYYDSKEKFDKTKAHDNYKNQWCKDHHINLIRIPYTHYENIILEDLLPITSNYKI